MKVLFHSLSSIGQARLSLRLSYDAKPLAKGAENGTSKRRSSNHQAGVQVTASALVFLGL